MDHRRQFVVRVEVDHDRQHPVDAGGALALARSLPEGMTVGAADVRAWSGSTATLLKAVGSTGATLAWHAAG